MGRNALIALALGLSLSLSLSFGRAFDEAAAAEPPPPLATATFAGGCFWCMQAPFDDLPGISKVTVGFTGGTVESPTYAMVSGGKTGHVESIQIRFDPATITYQQLLDLYWRQIDPLSADGQFCDRGRQYRAVIFYHDEVQRGLAEASREALKKTIGARGIKDPIVTEIVAASTFYPAGEEHQDYYKRNPIRYNFFRWNCGRDKRLDEIWGKDRDQQHRSVDPAGSVPL